MKVCFLGGWDGNPNGFVSEYTQAWNYLTRNGVDVVNGCIEKSRFSPVAAKTLPLFVFEQLLWRWPRLLAKALPLECDWIYFGRQGHYDAPMVKLLAWLKGVKSVYNVMDSEYKVWVEDRKKFAPKSLRAKWCKFLDWLGIWVADAVIVHNESNARWCHENLGLEKGKTIVLPQGVWVERPARVERKDNRFVVAYVGSFIPHHGLDAVIDAAVILREEKDVVFKLAGGGGEEARIRSRARGQGLENVEFTGFLPYEAMPAWVAAADAALGVFGTNSRARDNVVNKAWMALGLGVPLVTADSPAAGELGLKNGEHAMLVEAGSGQAIAEAVRALKTDKALRERVGETGRRFARENYSAEILGERLVREVRARFGL